MLLHSTKSIEVTLLWRGGTNKRRQAPFAACV